MLVRTDLSIPQITVQSCHAAFEAATLAEYEEHPSIIVCGVKNLAKLEKEMARIQDLGLSFKPFYENDLDNQLTSICVAVPDEFRHEMRKLQLLRSYK